MSHFMMTTTTPITAEIVPTTPQEIKTRLAQLAIYSDTYTLQQLADALITLAADITLLIPKEDVKVDVIPQSP